MEIIKNCKESEQDERQKSYEDREESVFNIPIFLFLFYIFALMTFVLLPVTIYFQ